MPLLVSIGQSSIATAELRRFVELILWTLYFTDHRVEWRKFLENKAKGFAQDQRKPIAHAAHRQLNAYIDYAEELMEDEPSGLGSVAVSGMRSAVRDLNAAVHAGRIARESQTIPPHDDMSEKALRGFLRIERAVFSNCCILVSAFRREKFNKLSAISRSYFDVLVAPAIRKKVRSGPFGLP
jgi:hypothetical protein